MMVSCPKCNFSQPEDQFCAKCGVDMIAFRLRHNSQKKPLNKNPLTYIGAVVVVCILGIALFKNPLRSLSNEEPKQPTTFTKKDVATEEFATLEEPAQALSVGSPPTQPSARPTERFETASLQNPVKTSATPVELKGEVAVHFVELDVQAFEAAKEELAASGQYVDFGDYRAALVLEPAQFLRANHAFGRTAGKLFNKNLMVARWVEPGFQIQVKFDSLTSPAKGEVALFRVFNETGESRALPVSSFEIQPGMGWLVSLSLGNYLSQQDLVPSAKQGPLAIINFPKFKAKMSDLAFLFDFHFDSTASAQ